MVTDHEEMSNVQQSHSPAPRASAPEQNNPFMLEQRRTMRTISRCTRVKAAGRGGRPDAP